MNIKDSPSDQAKKCANGKAILMNRIKSLLLFILFAAAPVIAKTEHSPETCTVVLFGATGDLTAKKLLPALYALKKSNTLSQNASIIGFARRDLTNETFRDSCKIKTNGNNFLDPFWEVFEENLFYLSSDFDDVTGYQKLKTLLDEIETRDEKRGGRLYYLATQPSSFPIILEQLHKNGLLDDPIEGWTRVMFEKPFGNDLASAIALQETLDLCLKREQVFRIDHYLAKEGLLNFMTQRFQNTWLEPMWNANWIDHIQITMSEEIGIGSRANLWEETGALRDSFQNHLLQILALVAMEPPERLDAASIAQRKIETLNRLRPIKADQVDEFFIRGQYTAGTIGNILAAGFRQETGVAMDSTSETFVAAKLYIDAPRWKDVPFYLIGGKRLPRQTTEIAVVFKPAKLSADGEKNVLFIRVQPNAGIYLATKTKVPGLDDFFAPALIGYSPEKTFSTKAPDAYTKLFYDAIRGDAGCFVEGEEQIAAWRFLEPVLHQWGGSTTLPYGYPAGSWGPEETNRLFLDTGHQWLFLDN